MWCISLVSPEKQKQYDGCAYIEIYYKEFVYAIILINPKTCSVGQTAENPGGSMVQFKPKGHLMEDSVLLK